MEIFEKPVIQDFILIDNNIYDLYDIEEALEDLSGADGFSRYADFCDKEMIDMFLRHDVMVRCSQSGYRKSDGYEAFLSKFNDLWTKFYADKT